VGLVTGGPEGYDLLDIKLAEALDERESFRRYCCSR
jgi:hypothetical protein